MSKIKNIISLINNKKYYITLIIFSIWITFISSPNILGIQNSKTKKKKINQKINYYSKEINKNSEELDKIKNDTPYIIKLARENYFMKKENEDIFIINK